MKAPSKSTNKQTNSCITRVNSSATSTLMMPAGGAVNLFQTHNKTKARNKRTIGIMEGVKRIQPKTQSTGFETHTSQQ